MSNLLATLRSSATTLDALQRSVGTVQNNVSNASTPGYVRQRMHLAALDFNPETGLTGGVTTTGLASARNRFAEAAVRSQTSYMGTAEELSTLLTRVESTLNVNDGSGVAVALDKFFGSVTSWSLAPSSLSEKENVMAAAEVVADSFNRAIGSLQQSAVDAREQLGTSLASIDTIAERIRLYNVERVAGRPADAGSDASLHADLEELAGLLNFQALWHENGSVTILAGGRSALVAGTHRYSLAASFESPESTFADPSLKPATLRDADGNDITDFLTEGKTGAVLKFLNKTVTGYIGGPNNAGVLNLLAQQVADRVNTILASGYPPPHEPYHLFIYGSTPTSVAQSLRVNPGLAAALLDATDPAAVPPVVNGKALQLAALARPTQTEDMIDGTSYIGYFGRISAGAGRDVAAATKDADSRQQLLSQARSLREEISGVSLDEEAVHLVEYQRAYQATARLVTTLTEMTEMAVNIGRV
jgi:flagellar hook-associated protein 1 FlgK